MAYIGAEPVPGQNREVDDISSGFNGNATAFTLQVSSVNVSPESANNILINLGGVLQNPGTDYTIAASTITFTTAPAAGLSFFGLILGAGINTATVADQTIGPSKLINTAVTAGSYTTADITVDAQGRITAAASGTISGAEIADQAVTNAKVNNSAAIAGTKISPNFGSQNIVTTGTLASADVTVDGSAGGTLTLGGSSAHTSKLVIADNTGSSNGNLLVEGGDGGDFFTINSAGNVIFQDNKKAIFGAGSDLQIYHQGSHSYIQDAGAGSLILVGNNVTMQNAAQNENMFSATQDGAVELFHNGVSRFSTFSEGCHVNVAGNSGLRIIGTTANVDPRIVFRRKNNDANNSEPAVIQMTYVAGTTHESGHLDFFTNGSSGSAGLTKRFRIQNDGLKYLDNTFNSTANNARKSYFTSTGQQFHGRNANEHYIVFQDVSNNQIGGIVRGSGSSVAYNTSSDYRLKENIVDLTDAITRLKTLSPKRFNFISDPSITLDGFIAHEVTAVPEAVEGEKDAVVTQAMIDSQEVEQKSVGDPIYQGIDQSKLVPLLTAALQEAITKIETLETKVAALEAA